MRILLSILACLVLHVSVLAQFPPILRQSLTTNTASNPSAAGQVPIWSGTSWVPGTAAGSVSNAVLVPGSPTNGVVNGKVLTPGVNIYFTTNNTTNLLVNWNTNVAGMIVTNLYVTNLFVTNINGIPISSITNDSLWTNTATEYLPTRTNSFGFAKGGGGLWLGTNATNNWGPLGPSDSLVAIRDAVNGEAANQFFTFLVRGTVTNATSIDGVLTGTQSILSSQATNDLNGVTYAQLSAQTDGVAFLNLSSAGTTHAYIADAGNSYLNGTAVRLGIGNSSPEANLHITGNVTGTVPVKIVGGAPHATNLFEVYSNDFRAVHVSPKGYLGVGTGTNNDLLGNVHVFADRTFGSTAGQLVVETVGTNVFPAFTSRQARGSLGLPAPTQSNDVMFRFGARGRGDTAYSSSSRGSIEIRAADTWTDASQRTHVLFLTSDTATALERMRVTADGFVGIGTNSPKATLHVHGTAAIESGITNNGGYKHPTGAFADAIFVSSTASGDAIWSTNLGTVVVTNLYVTNINGVGAAAFTNLYWTNDTAVLKGTAVGLSPRFALRWGALDAGGYVDAWNATNVGFWSVAMGSNVLARGLGSMVHGVDNVIGTNANFATISGGRNNSIETNSFNSTISGGNSNRIIGLGTYNSVIAGGSNNIIQQVNGGNQGMVIGGGINNRVFTNFSAVLSGQGIDSLSEYSVVCGGVAHDIDPSGSASRGAIVGGELNGIVNGTHGFIGGGYQNGIGATSGQADYGVVGGGRGNNITQATSPGSTNAVIGGGLNNKIAAAAHYSVIAGGAGNLIDANRGVVIGGGEGNTVNSGSAHFAQILGGLDNDIGSSGAYSAIIGNSNILNGVGAFIVGNRTTNAQPASLAIGFSGSESTELTKSTFTTTNTIIRTSLATAPDTVVTLAADNQVVDITKRSYVRIQSDSAVAGDRTFVLTGTNVAAGARITLEWVGTNAGELVDDAAMSGAGNQRMSATWTPTQYDSVSFIFNGTDVIETARSTN